MKKVDYIVPMFKPDKVRLNNFDFAVENFIKKQYGIEVNLITVNQDLTVSKVFNKQWLTNIGIKKAQTVDIFVADMDVYSSSDRLMERSLWMSDRACCDWLFPWKRLIYLNKSDTDAIKNEKKIKGPYERNYWPEPMENEGGIIYFKKWLWERVGGCNEWIKELRGADNDLPLRFRVETSKHYSYGPIIHHLWHPTSKMKRLKKRKKLNRKILEYTKKNPDEIVELLRKQDKGNPKGSYADKMSFYESRSKV